MLNGFMAEHFSRFKKVILPKLSKLLVIIEKKKRKKTYQVFFYTNDIMMVTKSIKEIHVLTNAQMWTHANYKEFLIKVHNILCEKQNVYCGCYDFYFTKHIYTCAQRKFNGLKLEYTFLYSNFPV